MKIILLIFLLFCISCAPLEVSRLLGVGTRPFKEQGKVYSKVFDKDFFSCYAHITKRLKKMGVSFYRGRKKKNFLITTGFNSIFSQCSESTEVAIFFTEIENLKTRVEVASLNYSLSEFAASKIFDDSKDEEIEDAKPEEESLE